LLYDPKADAKLSWRHFVQREKLLGNGFCLDVQLSGAAPVRPLKFPMFNRQLTAAEETRRLYCRVFGG